MPTGKNSISKLLACATIAASISMIAIAQTNDEKPTRPTFNPDGSVNVPAFVMPPSEYLSEEAVSFMKLRSKMPAGETGARSGGTIEELRANTARALSSRVSATKQRYPVNIEDQKIAGVPIKVITPKHGKVEDGRLLINVHGGAFQTCWDSCALLESIPIAVVGNWKVISVDYRQGPEHVFPAASEDVEKVYRSVLKDYRPENVGLYGCSAGGILTAQSVAWFQNKKLPLPGAIGIFGASAGRVGRGDSVYTSAYIGGERPPPRKSGEENPPSPFRNYFEGADMRDPLVSPLVSPEVLSRFPSTLIVTGTRAGDLSGSVYSHYQMKKFGVDAQLLVAEALGHCFWYDSNLPESRDAHDLIVGFFDEHLGSKNN